MARTNKINRRQIPIGFGYTAVALSLNDLLLPNV